jgi:hypothetical protein
MRQCGIEGARRCAERTPSKGARRCAARQRRRALRVMGATGYQTAITKPV